MKNVAREMNLADTAFFQRRANGFDLRRFTSSVEPVEAPLDRMPSIGVPAHAVAKR